jgi:hypothetical protein
VVFSVNRGLHSGGSHCQFFLAGGWGPASSSLTLERNTTRSFRNGLSDWPGGESKRLRVAHGIQRSLIEHRFAGSAFQWGLSIPKLRIVANTALHVQSVTVA